MATERIQIQITERGGRRVVREIRTISRTSDRAQRSVGGLGRALGLLAGFVTLRSLSRLADSITSVENRLRLVTQGAANTNAVFDELISISNRTRTSFEANAELFTRTALATQNLGLTQRETLNFTESLAQATVLSGASAIEASNAIRQLSQGLQAGALRGEEFRSVSEQLPIVLGVIADNLGLTRGELRELAFEGGLTAEIIVESFQEAEERLAELFEQTIPTIGQSFEVVRNQFIDFISDANRSTGIFRRIADAILFLGNNIDTFARVILAGVLVLGLRTATRAVVAFTVALAANPIGFLITALTTAIALLTTFADRIAVTTDGVGTLRDVATVVFRRIGQFLSPLIDQIAELAGPILGDLEFSIEGIVTAVATAIDVVAEIFRGGNLRRITTLIVAELDRTGDLIFNIFVEVVERIIRNTLLGFQALGDIILRLFQSVRNVAEQNLSGLAQTIRGNFEAAQSAFDAADAAQATLTQQVESVPELLAFRFEENSRALGEFNILEGLKAEVEPSVIDDIGAEFAALAGAAAARLGVDGGPLTQAVTSFFDEVRAEGERRAADEAAALAADSAARAEIDRLSTLGSGGFDTRGDPDAARSAALQQVLADLRQQADLLSLTNQEREVQNDLLQIETSLQEQKIELTATERELLATELERLQGLRLQADLLEEIRGPEEALIERQTALNALFEAGRISAAEYAEALRQIRVESLETDRTLAGGFERGLLRIQDTILNFSDQAEATLVNAFGSAEDALVEFVQTGEFNFSRLVDSILADLVRLLARQALFGLVGAFTGGGTGASSLGGFLFGGARQSGGPVTPGREFLVGERGPELFRPPSRGTIVPNEQLGGQASVVNVINVTDPDEVTSALNTPQGEQQILNIIRRNRQAVREVTA